MSEQFPRATLPGTEVRSLHSKHVGDEYRIFVSFPYGYHESEDDYPVLYVTDGNWTIPYFASFGFRNHPLPPMIVVTIGYPADDIPAHVQYRERDFLPTRTEPTEPMQPGGAPKFLKFIREELFDFINAEYRTRPEDRTYFGYSYGGTFGTFMLFNEPDTFSRYIIGAPALHWEDEICFEFERSFAEKNDSLPVKLYFGVGTLDPEIMALTERLHQTIQRRNYSGLDMHLEIYEDEDHITAGGLAASRGIRSVLK